MPLPIWDILKSAPFWALMAANFGSMWAFMTVTTYGPTYLKMIYDINVKKVRASLHLKMIKNS
jgi:hypothetical protein